MKRSFNSSLSKMWRLRRNFQLDYQKILIILVLVFLFILFLSQKSISKAKKQQKSLCEKEIRELKKDIRITKTNLKYGTRELRLLWRELEIEKKEAEYAKKVITKNSNYQTEGNEQNNIDLVYTWGGLTKSIDASDRYNYELQYSIRSVYKHLPWINKIYVLVHSEADYPYWLKQADEQDKVIVVDVCDYFTNHKHCPTSNSFTVFSVMHGIKGLANKFILMDDNVFFNQPLKKEYFFTKDHLLRVFERHNRMNIYQNRNFKDIHYPEYKYAAYSYLPKPMRRDFINKFHEYYQGYTEFVQSHNSRYRGIIEDFAMVYYEYFYEKDWLKSENYKRIGFYQIPMEHEDNIIEEFNKIYNDLKSKEVKVFNCNDDFSTESEIYKKQLKVLFSFYNKLYPEVPFFEVENPNHHKYF
ncbi:hypothetical protein M0813_18080 [Anaeramoeba flamelloides]|uniref:Stealth protein CR2 conserved region 2 domain-containing protein n=1 Tax=Anaeramoeba flamelloides TaxID=1746091 RepID=A0ABQ8YTK7_9EUKA|nr:hypothetical protein M0813_18080 [Anaeramoeba flamelloides]